MRITLIFLPLLLLTTACDAPRLADFMPISFANRTPIQLDIYEMNVQNEYQQPKRPPYVEHLFPIPLEQAIETWAQDRIKTAGSDRSLLLVVKNASVTEKNLPTTTGIMGWFTDDQEKEYTGNVLVELRIYGNRALSLASTEVHATRSITLPQSASLAERDELFYQLTKALMRDLNAELEKNIHQYFSDYIQYTH